jgi:hypothetical protein
VNSLATWSELWEGGRGGERSPNTLERQGQALDVDGRNLDGDAWGRHVCSFPHDRCRPPPPTTAHQTRGAGGRQATVRRARCKERKTHRVTRPASTDHGTWKTLDPGCAALALAWALAAGGAGAVARPSLRRTFLEHSPNTTPYLGTPTLPPAAIRNHRWQLSYLDTCSRAVIGYLPGC